MKKKILALLLCALMTALMFTGCKESTFETINNAIQKTNQLDSVNITMEMEINVSTNGVAVTMPLEAEITAEGIKGDSPKILSKAQTEIFGQNIDIQVYQEGTWAYISAMGMDYKVNTDEDQNDYDFAQSAREMVKELPADILEDVEITEGDDGSKSIMLTLSGDKFKEIYADFAKNISEDNGIGALENITIEDANVEITVNNGYISTYSIDYKMSMERVSDEPANARVIATVTYIEPGKAVTVTPPEGYQDFQTLDIDGEL